MPRIPEFTPAARAVPSEPSIETGAATKTGSAAAPNAEASFGGMLDHFVSEVDSKIENAATAQKSLLTGETANLHQSMIAMQEASVAFSLMVEVRNKLVESYQELMRMQV